MVDDVSMSYRRRIDVVLALRRRRADVVPT